VYQRPNSLDTRLPHIDDTRPVMALLRHDIRYHTERGDLKTALRSCRALLNTGRSIGDEPLGISQLVRAACDSTVCQAGEHVLAQGEPPAEEMRQLQKLLRDEEAHRFLWISLRGDRAVFHEVFTAIEAGDLTLSEIDGGRPSWEERWLGFIIRDRVRGYHPEFFTWMGRLLEIAELPESEQRTALEEFDTAIHGIPPTLATLILPGAHKCAQAYQRVRAQMRCLRVALAAERYRQAHGAWPGSLEHLVPEFLPEVLSDPFDGEPLRYREVEDGRVIYSVGQDGIDDGGVLFRSGPLSPGTDFGCRLWDVAHRRQPAPPAPLPMPPEAAR
jgi:hypothetical protein